MLSSALAVGRKNELYGYAVGYNGEGIDLQTHEPQRAEFKATFGNSLLHCQPLDHMNCPLFAMAYFKTNDPDFLHKVLILDYRKFFKAVEASTPC